MNVQHCIVQIDEGDKEPAIAVHNVIDGIGPCHDGFLFKEIVYRDCVENN